MTELQRAMARYEDARIAYRKAVLASLHGSAPGEGIREAIVQFKAASAELKRVQAAGPAQVVEEATPAETGWSLVRRFLKAG